MDRENKNKILGENSARTFGSSNIAAREVVNYESRQRYYRFDTSAANRESITLTWPRAHASLSSGPAKASSLKRFKAEEQQNKENCRNDSESPREKRVSDVGLKIEALVGEIVVSMKKAGDEDRLLDSIGTSGTRMIYALHTVMAQVKRKDLQVAFLKKGLLNVFAYWLSPLPSGNLPSVRVRESLLSLLAALPPTDESYLKESGIENALQVLSKHSKETEENRVAALGILAKWSRMNENETNECGEERFVQNMPEVQKEPESPKIQEQHAQLTTLSMEPTAMPKPKPANINFSRKVNRFHMCFKRFNARKRAANPKTLAHLSTYGGDMLI